jgi:enamine deaminase RidA (YjgF/YER057c/UK114 family)
MKKVISSGTMWEKRYSYSRVVATGNRAVVAGTVAIDDNGVIIGKNKPEVQVKFILEKIERSITEAGFKKDDIVRTRMYVTNIHDFEKMGQVHGDFFKGVNPAFTMIEVKSLIHKDMLVEIEADLDKGI